MAPNRKRKQSATSTNGAKNKKTKKNVSSNMKSSIKTSKSALNKSSKKTTSKNGNPMAKKKSDVHVEEDVEVDDEDVAFFEENEQFSSFLSSINSNALTKSMFTKNKVGKAMNMPKNIDSATDNEDEVPLEKLEAHRRQPGWKDNKIDLASKLPVKFMDGSVRQNKLLVEKETQAKEKINEASSDDKEEDDDHVENEEENDELVESELDSDVSDMEFEEIQDEVAPVVPEKPMCDQPPPSLNAAELKLQRQRRLNVKKIEIAQLCELILENPEAGLKKNKEHPRGLSKLQELHALTMDHDATVQKLSLLSELSVFLDILPDYRIRLHQENEKQNGRPLKKTVQQLQDYEASMLNNYQIFLKRCAQIVKDGIKGKGPDQARPFTDNDRRGLSLAEIGVKCLSELLKVKYAFNFHLNLIIALVPMADSHFPSIRQAACSAFVAVYQSDRTCTASLDIVKQISLYVKQKEHRVKADIIETFLKMPLEITMEQGEASRKKAKNERKKRRKDMDSIASGLKEAEAVVDKTERDKTQGDILHELVLIYFRILKQATYSTALPAVLEGLSKFAFLINLDIMIDLLKVLKAVLKEDILPLGSAFHAVLTGLRALQGPGRELQVDDKDFVDILYKLLRRFSEGEDVSCFLVALNCVEAVFLRRKEIVVDRVAAFIKRLLLISLSLPPHQILAILALVRSLMHRYTKLHQLLESDVDRVASGVYRADIDDPDFSNPYSSACWELSLLANHFHPTVASFALGTASLGPSLPNEYPKAMYEKYNTESTGLFVPHVSIPSRNPLFSKLQTQQKRERNKKRQRERNFYIQDPIATGMLPISPFYAMCKELDSVNDESIVLKQ